MASAGRKSSIFLPGLSEDELVSLLTPTEEEISEAVNDWLINAPSHFKGIVVAVEADLLEEQVDSSARTAL